MFKTVMENVKNTIPLVHCITNYVTVNDCANMLLASGCSPIMADDLGEVEDITTICTSLVINIGTLNERTVDSMVRAGKKANELGHTVVLDPVGAGASALRNSTINTLLDQVKFTVIRGNISEIKFIAQGTTAAKGVDADEADTVTDQNLDSVISFAQKLSEKTGATIAITGAIDIVADANMAYVIRNGHSIMSKITGTGCMLTAVIAGYVGGNKENVVEATATAVTAMGYCGELAEEKIVATGGGTGSFKMFLIDAMSNLTYQQLKGGAKVESR